MDDVIWIFEFTKIITSEIVTYKNTYNPRKLRSNHLCNNVLHCFPQALMNIAERFKIRKHLAIFNRVKQKVLP